MAPPKQKDLSEIQREIRDRELSGPRGRFNERSFSAKRSLLDRMNDLFSKVRKSFNKEHRQEGRQQGQNDEERAAPGLADIASDLIGVLDESISRDQREEDGDRDVPGQPQDRDTKDDDEEEDVETPEEKMRMMRKDLDRMNSRSIATLLELDRLTDGLDGLYNPIEYTHETSGDTTRPPDESFSIFCTNDEALILAGDVYENEVKITSIPNTPRVISEDTFVFINYIRAIGQAVLQIAPALPLTDENVIIWPLAFIPFNSTLKHCETELMKTFWVGDIHLPCLNKFDLGGGLFSFNGTVNWIVDMRIIDVGSQTFIQVKRQSATTTNGCRVIGEEGEFVTIHTAEECQTST